MPGNQDNVSINDINLSSVISYGSWTDGPAFNRVRWCVGRPNRVKLQAPVSLAREFERRQLAYASDNGGQPPFHPRMMLVLLLYAYSAGVFSSRKIM